MPFLGQDSELPRDFGLKGSKIDRMEGESDCLRGISGGISKEMELNATKIRSLNAETRGILTGRIGFWADLKGR